MVAITGATITAAAANSGLVCENQTYTATYTPTNATPPITYTWSPEPDSGQGTATAIYSFSTTCGNTISVTIANGEGSASDSESVTLDLTYMQIADAIKDTVEAAMSADLLKRAYGYDAIPEGIQDYGAILVHWQATEILYSDTDRYTFGPGGVTELLFYCDYVQNPRNHMEENNDLLTQAASELHNIFATESTSACADGQCPPFGLCALKNFTWRGERVILDYGGVLFYAARFEIRIRLF